MDRILGAVLIAFLGSLFVACGGGGGPVDEGQEHNADVLVEQDANSEHPETQAAIDSSNPGSKSKVSSSTTLDEPRGYDTRFPDQSEVEDRVSDKLLGVKAKRENAIDRLKGRIEQGEALIARTRKTRRAPVKGMSAKQWLESRAYPELRQLQMELNLLRQKPERGFLMEFDGRFGEIAWTVKINQIIDSSTFMGIVVGEEIDAPMYFFRGWSTASFADESLVAIEQSVAVTGKQSYETILGAQKTLLVIEPFDWQRQLGSGRLARLREEKVPSLEPLKFDPTPEQKHQSDEPKPARNAEEVAAGKLRLAKSLLRSNRDAAERRLQEIIDEFGDTEAAAEAKKLLD